MKQLLAQYPEYREKLYIRGFLFSQETICDADYPFYGCWKRVPFCGNTLLVHPLQHVHSRVKDDICMALIGHAYNPFTMEAEEEGIIRKLSELYLQNEEAFWSYFNELTGVFTLIWIAHGKVFFVGDPTGMQNTFYAIRGQYLYVASHTMLLGELLSMDKDTYIQRLISYRFFRLLGNSCPGDLTQFVGLKRVTPNFCYEFGCGMMHMSRFFVPSEEKGKTYNDIVTEVLTILHNSLDLISQKWSSPAISMTGGCDSKTTLACANGLYDEFSYFSYSSSVAEALDAEAAEKICSALGLVHKTYQIPMENESEDTFRIVGKILRWNSGDVLDCNRNDVRKRIYLDQVDDFDVEVKSWASEVGRAYFSKRFNNRKFFTPKPTARACTTLYKFFLHDRKLVRDTDRIFRDFIKVLFRDTAENQIPWFEQFFWEFRVPSWNGLVITGEHRYSSDITIPYNNRRLLTLLLSVPLEDRINDSVYADIRKRGDPRIDETGISVVNMHHTSRRAKFEDLYWIFHSRFPF